MNKQEYFNKFPYDYNRKIYLIPMYMHIELTTCCPVNCSQCYLPQGSKKDMDFELLKGLIHLASRIGLHQILLTGGEPLLFPKIVDCIKLISDNRIHSVISSSGVGLTVELSDLLFISGLSEAHISLNGSCAEVHNRSRNRFHEGLSAIKRLKASGNFCGINWVARKDNIADFDNLAALAISMNVDRITILSNKVGRDGVYSQISSRDMFYLAKKIKKNELAIPIYIDPCFHEMNTYMFGNNTMNYCKGGRLFFDVSCDGGLSPCRHINKALIFKDHVSSYNSFSEYWLNSKELNLFRSTGTGYICKQTVSSKSH